MALDYAAILSAGRTLVPDMRVQGLQDQQAQMQREQFGWQKQQADLQVQEHQRGLTEQAEYKKAVEQALLSHNPQAILDLMARFPTMATAVKPLYEAMDERQKSTNLTQMGTIFRRAQDGDYKGAADFLEERIIADRAAGHDVSADEAILAGFRSDDPVEQRAAGNTVGIHLAAISGPKDFSEAYGKFFPTDRTSAAMREYDDRVTRFGKPAADEWLATQDVGLVTTQPGGSVYDKRDFIRPFSAGTPAQPKGGDPASTGAGFTMPVTGGTFTSGFGAARDGGARSHNGIDIAAPLGSTVTAVKPGKVVAVGNQPDGGLFVRVKHPDGTLTGYAHLGRQDVKVGQDVDVTTPLGIVGTSGNATGPVLHLVVRDRNGKAVDPRPLLGGAVTVKSVQEATRLAAGTRYRTPDGREFVR